MTKIQNIIFIALLFLYPIPLFATGPSWAEINIIPVACNDNGVLLFESNSRINRSGGHGYEAIESKSGILVVSQEGLFKEYLFDTYVDINWKMPSKKVETIMKQFEFTEKHIISHNIGEGEVTWSPSAIIGKNGVKYKFANQRSIQKFNCTPNGGSKIKASFFYKGVALFRNKASFNDEDEVVLIGTNVHIPNQIVSDDVGIDLWTIDAICIIK